MSATIRTPTARECELCGRKEAWDDTRTTWYIVEEDGEKLVGEPFCIHEWDINGTFNPLADGSEA